MINDKNRKGIIAVTRVYICEKTHVDFLKTFASTFSAYATCIYIIDKMVIK